MSTLAYVLKGNSKEEAKVDEFLKNSSIKVIYKQTSSGKLFIKNEQ